MRIICDIKKYVLTSLTFERDYKHSEKRLSLISLQPMAIWKRHNTLMIY